MTKVVLPQAKQPEALLQPITMEKIPGVYFKN
jgi:hypothetical protein